MVCIYLWHRQRRRANALLSYKTGPEPELAQQNRDAFAFPNAAGMRMQVKSHRSGRARIEDRSTIPKGFDNLDAPGALDNFKLEESKLYLKREKVDREILQHQCEKAEVR